ncbi:MAG: hypothetical protein AAB289_16715 [Chloroflexota bacterium]
MGDALVLFGVAGVGKSTVARHCSLEWPAKRCVDVATVREVLRSNHPELELSTYDVWKLAGEEPTIANLVRGFDIYTSVLWPTLWQVLHRSAADGSTLVLEGAMMSPAKVCEFNEPGLRLHPRMLFMTDADAHLQRLRGSVPEGSAIQLRLVESFPLVRALQDHLAQLSRCYDVPIIENRSLRTTVDGILASLPDSEHRRD